MINYMIELKDLIDQDQCEEYGLVSFGFYRTVLKIGTSNIITKGSKMEKIGLTLQKQAS